MNEFPICGNCDCCETVKAFLSIVAGDLGQILSDITGHHIASHPAGECDRC